MLKQKWMKSVITLPSRQAVNQKHRLGYKNNTHVQQHTINVRLVEERLKPLPVIEIEMSRDCHLQSDALPLLQHPVELTMKKHGMRDVGLMRQAAADDPQPEFTQVRHGLPSDRPAPRRTGAVR